MKRSIIQFAAILLFAGCNKIDDLLTFRISHQSFVEIESDFPIDPVGGLSILTPDIETNSTQEFQNNNTRADLVKDVFLEELKLTITQPSGKTFSFLKSITIYISDENGDNEIVLASLNNVDANEQTIMLETTDSRLDPYIKADTYNLRTSVITRETLTQDVRIQVNLKFKVRAESL